jgi:phage terminase large subunit
MLEIPDDIDAFTRSLTDAEAIALAEAIEAEEAGERWLAMAARFPIHGDPDASWPPDYRAVLAWRDEARAELERDPAITAAAKRWYPRHIAEFICHWGTTYDPRNAGRDRPAKMPFILFKRQREFVEFALACIEAEESGLFEKARDLGATWVACGISVALWLFWRGAAIGWGSRKEQLVDKIGDPDSIFEKMRMMIRDVPAPLLPKGFSDGDHMTYMKLINPENGSTITGEAGDNIGRGGRKLCYWKDESAHYERPEKIEAALADNTRVQFDISSVNGLGNVFHRRREAGEVWTPDRPLTPGKTGVFIMDWSDHPAKTQDWYDMRRAKAEADGLLHVFAQEVDRNYAAAVAGVIIPAEWVKSAIDAHVVLGIPDGGLWRGALDVADGDNPAGDANADAWFQGIVLREVDSWGARDTGETTRRFLAHAEGRGEVEACYDCIGVGSGVKAEANRLADEGKMPPRLRLVPWNAAASPLEPDEPVVPDDRDSPINKDFYENLKAQAWWRTRSKFERTHRAVEAVKAGMPNPYEPDDLISIDSRIPLLRQIEKELSQPTAAKSRRMKLIVNKTPEGTRSPNLGDAIVMADNPVAGLRPVITIARTEFEVSPFKLPRHFRKGFAMEVHGQGVHCLWGALDPDADILYLITEYARDYAEPGMHAQAISARGKWIPGLFDCDETNARQFDEMIRLYAVQGLVRIAPADRAVEAGIADLQQRIATGRLKAFSTCQGFFADYRGYRRDEDGRLVGGGFMNCARQLARPEAIRRMAVEREDAPIGGRAVNPYV